MGSEERPLRRYSVAPRERLGTGLRLAQDLEAVAVVGGPLRGCQAEQRRGPAGQRSGFPLRAAPEARRRPANRRL